MPPNAANGISISPVVTAVASTRRDRKAVRTRLERTSVARLRTKSSLGSPLRPRSRSSSPWSCRLRKNINSSLPLGANFAFSPLLSAWGQNPYRLGQKLGASRFPRNQGSRGAGPGHVKTDLDRLPDSADEILLDSM